MATQPILERYLSHKVRDAHYREDAVNITLARIAQGLDSLQDPKAYTRWAIQVGFNAARNHLRAFVRGAAQGLPRNTESGLNNSAHEPITRELSPEDRAMQAEEAELVHRVLDALTTVDIRTAQAYYFDGNSTSDIANHEGIPRGTVKSRLHTARKKLKPILQQALGDDNGIEDSSPER